MNRKESSTLIYLKRNLTLDVLSRSAFIKWYLEKEIGKYDISTYVEVSIIQTLIGCEGSIDHPKGHKVPFKTKTGEMISEGDICIIENEGLTREGQLLIIFKVKKQQKLSCEVVNELRGVFQKHNLI